MSFLIVTFILNLLTLTEALILAYAINLIGQSHSAKPVVPPIQVPVIVPPVVVKL